jgi:GrpB-like predicted nucleotidyltransferase (UPF0157 family)
MTHPAPIEICAYSSLWPEWFQAEREILSAVFSSHDVQIEHVGSSAVLGLAAKPIVDILLGAPSLSVIEAKIPALVALDYQYMPEHEAVFPQRRFFAKPQVRPRRFHVHAVERKSQFWLDHVAFRDALRADPELASQYERLKRELAVRFGFDRVGYTDAKSSFIQSVLAGVHTKCIRT